MFGEKSIGVIVIGCNKWGSSWLQSLLHYNQQNDKTIYEILGIYDSAIEQSTQLKESLSIEAAILHNLDDIWTLYDVKLIGIFTPLRTFPIFFESVISSKINVVCLTNLMDSTLYNQIYSFLPDTISNYIALSLDYLHFDSSFSLLKDVISSKIYGKIKFIECTLSCSKSLFDDLSWISYAQSNGGVLCFFGPSIIRLIEYISDETVHSVSGYTLNINQRSNLEQQSFRTMTACDYANFNLLLSNNINASCTLSSLEDSLPPNSLNKGIPNVNLIIHCEHATITENNSTRDDLTECSLIQFNKWLHSSLNEYDYSDIKVDHIPLIKNESRYRLIIEAIKMSNSSIKHITTQQVIDHKMAKNFCYKLKTTDKCSVEHHFQQKPFNLISETIVSNKELIAKNTYPERKSFEKKDNIDILPIAFKDKYLSKRKHKYQT